MSALGAVLPLEKGPEDDDFFLTFDILSNDSYSRPNDPTLTLSPVDLENKSQIGLRTFDEINATYSEALGIDWTAFSNVNDTYFELRQSLPAIEDIDTFLSSHQVAIAQLAIAYCDALVNVDGNPNPDRGQMFPGFNFDAAPATAFDPTPIPGSPSNRDLFVVPLINYVMGTGLASQSLKLKLQRYIILGNSDNNRQVTWAGSGCNTADPSADKGFLESREPKSKVAIQFH